MKNIFFTFVILFAAVISSCKKEETPKPSASGDQPGCNLTVKIVDQSGDPVKGKIYIEHLTNPSVYIVDDSINASGIYETGRLIQGNYQVTVFASEGKKAFEAVKAVQMIEGVNRTMELFPFSNNGNIKIIATDQNGIILDDVSVALIPHANYGNTSTYAQLIAEAWEVTPVNVNGEVTFSGLPANYYYDYSVMIFRSAVSWDYPFQQSSSSNYISVTKGQTTTVVIKVSL